MSTQRPRVLHLISTLERAGAQVVVLGLARSMERYHSTIAYLWGGSDALTDAGCGCEVVDFSRNGRPDPLILPRLLGWARERRFDIIHTHLVHAGVLGKMVARSLSIPAVTTRHYGAHPKERRPAYRLEDRLCRSAYRIVAVSEAVRGHLLGRGHHPERIVVIPNGIDVAAIDRSLAATNLLPRSSHRPRIGSVGRLDPVKGFDLVLDAISRLRDGGFDIEAEFIGEGPEAADLGERAEQRNLGDRVRFLGSIPHTDVLARIRSWDLFVLPSRREAFGIVLLEAMAVGTPVLAAGTEGIPEIVVDGTGLLVPAEDSGALADGIRERLLDRELLVGDARRARAHVERRFRLGATAAAHTRLYDEILDR